MKRILLIALFFCITSQIFAQTDGLTYQAVIIGPDELELPGVNSPDNYLPQTTINMRFSIIDGDNEQSPPEFQETRITETDEFGRVNLIIGKDNDAFKSISWDGGTKLLKVEIDFEGGSDFTLISVEELTYLPYAKHRDITASGNLDVDGNTSLNGQLLVEGPANFNDALNVNDNVPSYLSGTLTVDGVTNLNEAFNVNNQRPTDLSGSLRVGGDSNLEGTLDVLGLTTLNDLNVNGQASFGDLVADNLTVNLSSTLNGTTNINGATLINGLGSQVRITSNMPNVDQDYARITNHPLLIDGGNNGLAIRVNGGRNNDTNFITFYDTQSVEPWGRIEGETPTEFGENADYRFDQSSLEFDIYDSNVDLGFGIAYEVIAAAQLIKASTDFRACVGLGGCLASPGPADIAFAGVELVSATVQAVFATLVWERSQNNKIIYDNNKITYQGVTYASGSGDYAEYLERENSDEDMSFGDIVGLKGGKISKNIEGAERTMVVSFKPIVLGNMPQKNLEHLYEKVAFMGQVPVKVYGKVNIGDYIIPSGMNDGSGIAIPPSKIKVKQIKNIVGVAWSENHTSHKISMVNVAVGLNKNDNNPIIEKLEDKIASQSEEINALKSQISEIYDLMGKTTNGGTPSISQPNFDTHEDELPINNYHNRKYEVVHAEHGELVYWEVTREDIEKAFELAREQMKLNGVDVENHFVWKNIKENPKYKEELITKIQAKLEKQLHYHKKTHKD
ncbi:peptidase G2 autoproteolytic cleavage domain-containing protein [Winogradskyella haliclonae]|uniref:Peptidase G2 IMC autoproteolytic cleavage domain-containing protein n=1 Tax=Winogradskyella haliclonae TaxID=2048558 RepID=A0ABQ2C1P5_9FLAO|nr:peptidase G2 autoproteolytic cleavage domain-containing protein [Winogradskyella haliclonae]GGI58111.1 hypothetical protein GCM10011444_24200 [Winogradskyella haliclonae]